MRRSVNSKREGGGGGGHETKFVLSNRRAHALRDWLARTCLDDPSYPAGLISSIYFDTFDLRSLAEKVDSDFLKTKVRVRWYGDIATGRPEEASFLEVKSKEGARRDKIRIRAPWSGEELSRMRLTDRKLLDPTAFLAASGVVVEGPLYPVLQISYRRRRYVEPVSRVRICLDWDIRAPRVNSQMMPHRAAVRLDRAVLEVKRRALDLPGLARRFRRFGCRKESFSKYAVCCAAAAGRPA